MKEKKERVAIIGSGLAGLTTAYLLHHDKESRFSVRIFESVGGLSGAFDPFLTGVLGRNSISRRRLS